MGVRAAAEHSVDVHAGDYPVWDLAIQTMTQEQADSFEWDVLDSTKIWPEVSHRVSSALWLLISPLLHVLSFSC